MEGMIKHETERMHQLRPEFYNSIHKKLLVCVRFFLTEVRTALIASSVV